MSLVVVLCPASSSAQAVDDAGGACATAGVGPGTLESGAIGDHGFSVAASAFPTETWLCVTFGPVSKRLTLPAGSPVPLPQASAISGWARSVVVTDNDGDRCATEPGNIVPGPHPLVTLHGDTLSGLQENSETFDVYASGTELWVCATFHGQTRGPVNSDVDESDRVGLGPPPPV